MAYIEYGQATVGGKQVAEVMASLQDNGDRLRNLFGWIGEIGAGATEGHTDFDVGSGQGQAFSDTIEQIMDDYDTFMTTNREKIERLARGK